MKTMMARIKVPVDAPPENNAVLLENENVRVLD